MNEVIAIIEFFFGLGLFINACLFIPQVFRLYKVKQSYEMSLVTFLGFNLINLFTALHGYIKHDPILAYGATFSTLMNTWLSVTIIYYRIHPQITPSTPKTPQN